MYAGPVTRQEERSAATRRVLLDATVACLVEHGYHGTTSVSVANRAGLSRGAQLHHFGTRDDMVVAAVEHLAQKRLESVSASLDRMATEDVERPGARERLARAALDLLAEALSGPLYAATLELWVASRANAALREKLVPAELRVDAELRSVCRTWVTDDPVLVRLTLDLLLGSGVSGMHADHRSNGRRRQAIEAWSTFLRQEAAL